MQNAVLEGVPVCKMASQKSIGNSVDPQGYGMAGSNKSAAAEHPMLLEGVLHSVFSYIDSPADRRHISEVCRKWHTVDCETRKYVYVAFIYSVTPSRLIRRFKNIINLKLKGKPRAYEFNLLPENWGGSVRPWVNDIVKAYPKLSALHLRRMEVSDDDLTDLAQGFSSLESLKLDYCSGFSTVGLLAVTRSCRSLKVLYLENSSIIRDDGGEWLHQLAMHNRHLEVLNFAMVSGLENASVDDLKAIIQNCNMLTSLKFSAVEADGLREVLNKSTSLKELGIFFNNIENEPETENEERLELPRNLTSISGDIPLSLYSMASQLIKLDLMTATSITAEQHHELLGRCPNLQNLQVRTIIGDEGLKVVAECCKDLRKIRIEEQGDPASVSHMGLISLAEGCVNLQKLAIYVSDISNEALRAVGRCCQSLVDFRFILTEAKEITELPFPLDSGFLAIMQSCPRLTRLCLYLRHGALTDQGMERIGRYSENLKALLLGCVGDSDNGFKSLAQGCRNLERLEMRDCPFSECGIVEGVRSMKSLKFLWVQGYMEKDPEKLLELQRRRNPWNKVTDEDFRVVEYFPGSASVSVQCLMFMSLAGPRLDCPKEMISPRGNGFNWR